MYVGKNNIEDIICRKKSNIYIILSNLLNAKFFFHLDVSFQFTINIPSCDNM